MRIPVVSALALFSALAVSGGGALASGGLSCTADDAFAAITIESGVTRGMGSPVFNFAGSSVIRDEAVAEDLRDMRFDQTHLPQYWLDGEELRMRLYRERTEGAHGFVEIEVRTRADEEGSYTGRYALTAFDMTGDTTGEGKTVQGEGAIECFAE